MNTHGHRRQKKTMEYPSCYSMGEKCGTENRYALIYFGLLCLVAEEAFLRSDLFMATPTEILREAR